MTEENARPEDGIEGDNRVREFALQIFSAEIETERIVIGKFAQWMAHRFTSGMLYPFKEFDPNIHYGLAMQIQHYVDSLSYAYHVIGFPLSNVDCTYDMQVVLEGSMESEEVMSAIKRLACADMYLNFAGKRVIDIDLARIHVAYYAKFLLNQFNVAISIPGDALGSARSVIVNAYLKDAVKIREPLKSGNRLRDETLGQRLFFLARETVRWRLLGRNSS
ncbi:MAG: hypothetical protein PHS44_01505 [Candidatus Dojkabacteria bacterium]|nr:hypothetical protein [Candidatus Dojkabacteria bacterium]